MFRWQGGQGALDVISYHLADHQAEIPQHPLQAIVLLRQLSGVLLVLGYQAAAFQGFADRRPQALEAVLEDIVPGPGLHAGHRGFFVGGAGDDQEGGVRAFG